MSQVESANRNQRVIPMESFGRQIDFYVLRTTLAINPSAGDEAQARLNALVQLIGLRATPCIINVEPGFQETDPADMNVAGTVEVNVLRFAIDAVHAWEGANPSLKQMISELGHGFTADNFSITYQESL